MNIAQPLTEYSSRAVTEAERVLPRAWNTVVWNDAVNLMNYVTWVFKTYFGYTHERAERLMKEVHFKGRAVVSAGSREEMEADVLAMCGYGLWATLEQEAD